MINSLIIGMISTIAVLVLSVEGAWSLYLQVHSIIIVGGGTITIMLFSTPGNVLRGIFRSLKALVQTEEKFADYRDELIQLSKTKRLQSPSRNELLNYAAELWEQGVGADLFIPLVAQKKNEIVAIQLDSVQAMKNLAKYPPALGMTGTVMGMVSLFASLDSNKSNIGSSLALAMTATFFGLILTNAFISPVADRMQINMVHYKRMVTSLFEVILLINQGEPQTLISDEVTKRAG